MPKRQTAGARIEEALREPVRSDRSRGLRALGALSLQLFPSRLKDGECRLIRQNKVALLEGRLSVQMLNGFRKNDLRPILERKSGDARSDGGKRNGPQAFFRRDAQGMRGRAAQSRCRGGSAQWHARRVNHVTRLQASAAGEGSAAHRNAPDFIALPPNLFSTLPPDGSGADDSKYLYFVGNVDVCVGRLLLRVALLKNYIHFICPSIISP